jgi:hypothetical protein
MGHIFSLNAIGEHNHHLGEVQGNASNFLHETTACMYASYICTTLVKLHDQYGLSPDLRDKLENQFRTEQNIQKKGHDNYLNGFLYCVDQWHPAKTFYDIYQGPSCSGGGVDLRSLYTQQAADYLYLDIANEYGKYGLGHYMQIMKDIKSDEEIDILSYCDETNPRGLKRSQTHRASFYAAAVARAFKMPEWFKLKYRSMGFPVDDELFEYYYNNRCNDIINS